MRLLVFATLAYTAVLVLALAVGLILIVYHLNGARASLKKIAAGLTQVDANVAPLETVLTAANTGLVNVRDNLKKVDQNLAPIKPVAVEGRN